VFFAALICLGVKGALTWVDCGLQPASAEDFSFDYQLSDALKVPRASGLIRQFLSSLPKDRPVAFIGPLTRESSLAYITLVSMALPRKLVRPSVADLEKEEDRNKFRPCAAIFFGPHPPNLTVEVQVGPLAMVRTEGFK